MKKGVLGIACLDDFKKNPDKYIEKIEKEKGAKQ